MEKMPTRGYQTLRAALTTAEDGGCEYFVITVEEARLLLCRSIGPGAVCCTMQGQHTVHACVVEGQVVQTWR